MTRKNDESPIKHKINGKEAALITECFRDFGEISEFLIMRRVKCNGERAKWIKNNIKTIDDLKQFSNQRDMDLIM